MPGLIVNCSSKIFRRSKKFAGMVVIGLKRVDIQVVGLVCFACFFGSGGTCPCFRLFVLPIRRA